MIANEMLDSDLANLSQILFNHDIKLVIVNTYGFIGRMRTQSSKIHTVTEPKVLIFLKKIIKNIFFNFISFKILTKRKETLELFNLLRNFNNMWIHLTLIIYKDLEKSINK